MSSNLQRITKVLIGVPGPIGPTGPTGPAGGVNSVNTAMGELTIAGGTNITVTESAGIITVTGVVTSEVIRDVIGAALTAGDGVTVTVDDVADTITIANAAPVPVGGNWYQMLGKVSGADRDVSWQDPPGVVVPTLLFGFEGDLAGLDRSGDILAVASGALQYVPYPYTERFIDTFSRDDTAPGTLGSAEVGGGAWAITGSGYLTAQVVNHRMIADGNMYAYQNLGWTPSGMALTASWETGHDGSVTMISSPDSGLLDTMIHVYMTPAAWNFQVREDGGAFVNLAQGTHTLIADGRPYTMSFTVIGSTATLSLPDGSEVVVTDDRIPQLMGPWCTWQLFGASASVQAEMHRVDAWQRIEARSWARVETGTTNLLINGDFETDTSSWGKVNTTFTQSGFWASSGAWSGEMVAIGAGSAYVNTPSQSGGTGSVSSGPHTFAVDIYADDSVIGKALRLQMNEVGGASAQALMGFQDFVLTGGPQRISFTASVAQADRTGITPFINLVSAVANDRVWIDAAQVEPGSYASSFTASTRAVTTISIPTPVVPASMAFRYNAADVATWQHAYLTAVGSLGTYGTVTHDGSNLVVSSTRSLQIAGFRADDRQLTLSEKKDLETASTWTWTRVRAS